MRAYSPDPERAARYALAAIRGYLAGGVIPVAKHFPGSGRHRGATPTRTMPLRPVRLMP